MPALYATELDSPRSDITGLLDTVAAVERTGDTYPCRLRMGQSLTLPGLPQWFLVPQARIKFPWDADVRPGDTVDVDDLGEWRITDTNSPQSDSLSLRATAVPAGDNSQEVFNQSAQTVTFRDDADPTLTVENVPIVIYEVSPEEATISTDAVNKRWGVLFSADLAYPGGKLIGAGDKLLGFSEIPFGASITKPYPTLNPNFPVVRAYLRERS